MDFHYDKCRKGRRIPITDLDAVRHTPPDPDPPAGETALPAPTPEDGRWVAADENQDVAAEPVPLEAVGTAQAPAEVGEASEVAELRERLAQVEDRWKRAAADLDNYRKRFDRELERLRQLERETIFRASLTVIDDVERALCAQGASSSPWYEGMEAIHRRMLAVLAQFEVEPFVPQGEMFSPERHEAVATANLPNEPPGKIVEVVQAGYLIEDRVLRPAKVIVVKRG